MHSLRRRRRRVGTLVSSIVSQVLAILLQFSSPSLPPLHSPSSLLFQLHHLSFLLLFVTISSSSPPEAATAAAAAFPSFISHSSSPSRKRKRRPSLHSEDNYHSQQQPSEEEDDDAHINSSSSSSRSSSSSSSLSSIRNDDAVCYNNRSHPLLLPLTEDPSTFSLCFRMTSTTFEWLSGLLEPLLECRDPVGSSLNLSPHLRLGIGLFRLSTGSSYQDISRRFSVSESTARFCTKQLCRVLCTNFRFWVAFPTTSELPSVSASFQSLTGLPNCCGAIECTRFEIRNGESVATQIIVDSASRILNIATGFRTRDESAVLRSSAFYKDVQEGHLLNSPPSFLEGVAIPQYLIGGKAYSLLPWLMVPFVIPAHTSSSSSSSSGDRDGSDFNALHRSARGPALRTLASLRNWGVLSRPMEEEEINMVVACIGACSILHNVLLMREDFSALSEDDTPDDHLLRDCRSSGQETSLVEPSTEKASAIRDALAATAIEVRAILNQRDEQRQ